jgi:DNA-binding response OmpR family regulator
MEPDRDVLVVEDDESLNALICRFVKIAGFPYRAALDGASALKQAIERLPRLILLDVMLPDTTGFEVCKQLKEDPRTNDVPIVMVTALGDDQNRERGLKAGAVAYLPKPFSSDALIKLIKLHAA